MESGIMTQAVERAKCIKLSFDYMHKDECVAHVELYNNGTVSCELYTANVMDNPLPFGTTPSELKRFIDSRCHSAVTEDKKRQIANILKLEKYNPLVILRITRGQLLKDMYWIRFSGDNAKYKDITSRNSLNFRGDRDD